ncbi:MAG: cysteine desulfurase NifS [Lentisphaerae bacterium]|nr:cysteine desulfurase NifS [Lentisphaerota bacterium]
MKIVYMDNNATTRVAPEVTEAMEPFFRELWGNPSSMHYFGGQVARHVEDARAKVAELIGADPSEIIFTSCGTESNNTAIAGAAEIYGRQARIVTSRVEHQAVLGPCRKLGQTGFDVVELGVDSAGQPDLGELRKALQHAPCFVTTMWANNETGVIFPIEEIAGIVKSAGGVLHVDAVQAAGKLPVRVDEVPVDMLSLSGHKIHAPKGIGVLYVRRGTKFRPFMLGGHQEHGRRAGTENVPYIVGLGRACEMAREHLREGPGKLAALRDRLEKGLIAACPSGVLVNGDKGRRLPNTTNMSFRYIEGEAILYHLSDLGIAASSGSACTSGSLEVSHVLRAMGVPAEFAQGSIRFSLSRYTTGEDVDYVIAMMPAIVRRLRALSPFSPPEEQQI